MDCKERRGGRAEKGKDAGRLNGGNENGWTKKNEEKGLGMTVVGWTRGCGGREKV